MKKAALHNLGCKVNSYETDAMREMLINDGYEIVPFHEKADVYVINTCSVTNIADHKSRQMIHRARSENPNAVIIAAGCYAQSGYETLRSDGSADIIIGNNNKDRLIELLHKFLADGREEEAISDISKSGVPFENLKVKSPIEHTRAFMKVQDGCDQFCSYCIIPYARGRIRSRAAVDVVREAEVLSGQGIREIVLTGIHLDSYGRGTGESLIDLIEAVAEVPGIRRIRLGSIEPRIITDNFLSRLSLVDKFCPHFHLSLQSGSASVLKRMNRKYTPDEYIAGVRKIRNIYDDPAITTDVIVGFPGETEDEFSETLDFAGKVGFSEMHIFKFSRRRGTRADLMTPQITEKVKAERSSKLIALSHEMTENYLNRRIGKKVSVLLEEMTEADGEKAWTGYTKEYSRVLIFTDRNLKNAIVNGYVGSVMNGALVLDTRQGIEVQ
jgi:threonylcarbamoyladenosine tRNA methylthiotransferase MtaB